MGRARGGEGGIDQFLVDGLSGVQRGISEKE